MSVRSEWWIFRCGLTIDLSILPEFPSVYADDSPYGFTCPSSVKLGYSYTHRLGAIAWTAYWLGTTVWCGTQSGRFSYDRMQSTRSTLVAAAATLLWCSFAEIGLVMLWPGKDYYEKAICLQRSRAGPHTSNMNLRIRLKLRLCEVQTMKRPPSKASSRTAK